MKILFLYWLTAVFSVFIFRSLIPLIFYRLIGDREGYKHAIKTSLWWFCNNNGYLIILLFANVLLFFSTCLVLISNPTPFSKILQPFYRLVNSIIESVKFLGFLLIGKRAEITKVVIEPKSGKYALSYIKALLLGNIFLIGYFFIAMSDEVAHFMEKFHENKKKRTPEKKEEAGEKKGEGQSPTFWISIIAFIEAAGQTIGAIVKHQLKKA